MSPFTRAPGRPPSNILGEKILLLLCVAPPILIALLALIGWLTYGVDAPYMDDWRPLFAEQALSLDPRILFNPSNDTLYPIGKALDAIAQRTLLGNAVAYQALSLIAILGSLLWLQWSLLSLVFEDKLKVAFSFLFTLPMLQPDSYWGLQNMAFHQAIPLVCILSSLLVVLRRRSGDVASNAIVLALGVISGLTYISGALATLACGVSMVGASLLRSSAPLKLRIRRGGAWMSAAGFVTSIPQLWVIFFYQKGTHRVDAPMAYPFEADFWFYMLGKVGRSLLLPASHPALSIVLTLLVIGFLGLTIVVMGRVIRKEEANRTETAEHGEQKRSGIMLFTVMICLTVSVLCYLFLVSAGRANLRPVDMTNGLSIFSFGYLRFHFFWVTLLWPWLAAAVVWRLGAHKSGLWLYTMLGIAVLWLAFCLHARVFDHPKSFREQARLRAEGIECLRRNYVAGKPLMCPTLEPLDLAKAVRHARSIGASFTKSLELATTELIPRGPQPFRPLVLNPGDSIDGQFKPSNAGSIDAVAIEIGTFGGVSNGNLKLTLCSKIVCRTGYADLSNAADNAPVNVALGSPLALGTGEGVLFRLSTEGASEAVALWLFEKEEGSASIHRFRRADGAGVAPPNETISVSVQHLP